MLNKDSFVCSENKLFSPFWATVRLENEATNEFNPQCIIIPSNQPQLHNKLQHLGLNTRIIELQDEESFLRIDSLCQTTTNPHLVFISHSTWSNIQTNQDQILFLKWLQSLKQLAQFKLSVVTLNALRGPKNNAVTNPLDAVYLGMTQTFAKEMPNANINSVQLEQLSLKNIQNLAKLPIRPQYLSPIFLNEEEYSFKKLRPIEFNTHPIPQGFKYQGNYLILGGTGGLGSLLARYLCDNYQAQVILVGRKVPSSDRLTQLTHPKMILEQADLSDEQSVKELLQRHPQIDGIIHSALVLDDSSLMTMSKEQLVSVLAPKVQGTVHLIKAMAQRHFDFVMFFSSIQSFIANAGQANYTAACLAKDALAELIEDAFTIKTHIINWGFWGEQGIVATDFYRQRMQSQEISSISAEEGLAVIEHCLQQQLSQVVMVKGSNKALNNMGIDLDPTTRSSRLLPPFNKTAPNIQYNNAMMEALDKYSKYQFTQIAKPQAISPKYEKLWEALSNIRPSNSPNRQELLNKFPELQGHVNLIDTCLSHLPAVVSGQTCPLSIMFPQGSFDLVEPVYRNNPVADYYNECMALAVERYVVEANQRGKSVRILEVGAGTGSTSEKVLPRLKGKSVHYVYSDLSHAFLNKARKEFASYDFIEYAILNIEAPKADLAPFDIILATNVIHATSAIPQTARNLFQLLNEDGMLLLNEITSRQDFATLTFGLTDGWWLSQDEYRIPYSPLLDLSTWNKVLTQAGFAVCYDHGDFGQHIIEAHRSKPQEATSTQPVKQKTSQQTTNQAYSWLRQLIAQVMHTPEEELQGDIPFSEYGIDSLISLELIKPMTDKVGYVPATLLFEYPTLNKLSAYFTEHFANQFAQKTIESPKMSVQSPKITDLIRSTISRVLHTPEHELEAHIPFSELGIDSLISLEIVTALQQKLGYLPATILFEYPTIHLLAQYIEEHNSLNEESTPKVIASNATMPERKEGIAIVGIAGKFPGADNCAELWDLLLSGEDAFKPIPSDRWINNDPNSYTQTAALINDPQSFDHEFFNIAPIDAERMDPQERLFLQTTYHAIEDAGLSIKNLSGQEVGCYVGVMNHGYSLLSLNQESQNHPSSLFWSIANRTSYQFNWHGPSFAVDSACSSSLTALHTAVTALLHGDCEVAVVGGVNLISHPRQIEALCQLHMLSKSNQCKPFGNNADGFVDGEGIISIVLMPYQKAMANNLRVYGVIRGSALNAGGKANGYSAPNPKAQSELIKKALKRAQLEPKDINVIEAHGTGTELGDPIELRSLTEAYHNLPLQSIPIGSIKGTIGHLESAAGLASVVKVLLQMQHKQLAPSLHSTIENPHLNLQNTPFFINKSPRTYTQSPVRAAISSFGAGGANAHVIIESHEPIKRQSEQAPQYLFALSAHSEGALQKELINLRNALVHEQADLMALSYGYCCIRSPQKLRLGFVVATREELINLCEQPLPQLKSAWNQSAHALIDAFNQGMDVDFKPLFTQSYASVLPAYPFDNFKHWVDAKETRLSHPGELIHQHLILGQAIAPAALSISMLYEHKPFQTMNNLLWKKIIRNPEELHIAQQGNSYQLVDRDQSTIYSQGELGMPPIERQSSPQHSQTPTKATFSKHEIYHYFKTKNYNYGPDFRVIQQASLKDKQVHSILSVEQDWGYALSPALIDGALQTAILTEFNSHAEGRAKIPFLIEQVNIIKLPALCQPIYCICTPKEQSSASTSSYDIELTDSKGDLLITLKGVVSITSTTDKLFDAPQEQVKTSHAVKVFELN
ncbi:SDR family NAD(P)-dependent oxidoreductase [Legionella bononiensis]|uniref:SDR family NAD(P)-dependent oxidoreductase n=1 Tax=Legionella bononiensis TaxID=2793102 RepID=A0ABS1WE24_9GAMM|nr:SDR family NAD(P)-dependent oxidoreductase [Legionella bononiensis]MBL7479524.1 SDR family NAD(P)-dependent oxidoreductase [Legionella bononiensis]MBL7527602.1 SDR family NAD(P)-dependent oxidoreductase [Legionella bononiensis]